MSIFPHRFFYFHYQSRAKDWERPQLSTYPHLSKGCPSNVAIEAKVVVACKVLFSRPYWYPCAPCTHRMPCTFRWTAMAHERSWAQRKSTKEAVNVYENAFDKACELAKAEGDRVLLRGRADPDGNEDQTKRRSILPSEFSPSENEAVNQYLDDAVARFVPLGVQLGNSHNARCVTSRYRVMWAEQRSRPNRWQKFPSLCGEDRRRRRIRRQLDETNSQEELVAAYREQSWRK